MPEILFDALLHVHYGQATVVPEGSPGFGLEDAFAAKKTGCAVHPYRQRTAVLRASNPARRRPKKVELWTGSVCGVPMGASFFPVFDRKVKTEFIQGAAIARGWDAIERVAKRAGVRQIYVLSEMPY